MIPIPNPELVFLIPEKIDETFKVGDQEAVKSEIQRENERKAQSRGTIFAVGEKVKFWKKSDLVSFHRAAAVEVKEDGTSYFSIHPSNILCKFVMNG